MVSLSASIARPLVKVIGKQLAAADTAEKIRKVFNIASHLMAPATGVRLNSLELGGVPCIEVIPNTTEPSSTLLYFHGGGYVFGSAKTYVGMVGRLAKAAGARVILPDYRLAPEHPYPACREDSLAVYRALLERCPEEELAVAGDSAGVGSGLTVPSQVGSPRQ